MHDLLLYAVIITIEPLPIIGFILVLSTDGGARNGGAFIAGWVACLLVVIGGTLLITGGDPVKAASVPGRGVQVATVVLGLALLGFGFYRRAHQLPAGESRPPPSWTTRLDQLGLLGAATVGVLLQPWALVAAGAASTTQADLSSTAAVIELVLFCLVSTASLIAMEAYTIRDAAAAGARLDALRSWLDRHRDRGIILLALIAGSWLVIKGVVGLIGS